MSTAPHDPSRPHHGEGPVSDPSAAATSPGSATPTPEPSAATPTPSGVDQLTAGARQMASGAKQLYGAHVAPAVKEGLDRARSASSGAGVQAGGSAQGPAALARRLAGPALAVLGIAGALSLMLPLASVLGRSIGWFGSNAPEGEGPALLVSFLLVAAMGLGATLVRRLAVRIAAAVVAILVGIFGIVDGFGNIQRLQEASGFISPGASLYLIGLVGVLMILAGAALLIPAGPRASRPVTETVSS